MIEARAAARQKAVRLELQELQAGRTPEAALAEQKEALRQIFTRIDADGSGTLDAEEVKSALVLMGKDISDDELRRLMHEFAGMKQSATNAAQAKREQEHGDLEDDTPVVTFTQLYAWWCQKLETDNGDGWAFDESLMSDEQLLLQVKLSRAGHEFADAVVRRKELQKALAAKQRLLYHRAELKECVTCARTIVQIDPATQIAKSVDVASSFGRYVDRSTQKPVALWQWTYPQTEFQSGRGHLATVPRIDGTANKPPFSSSRRLRPVCCDHQSFNS